MLLLLLAKNLSGSAWPSDFGGGTDWSKGDKLPEVPSAGGGGGASTSSAPGGENPSEGMPNCPPGKLPFYTGNDWICRDANAQTPAPGGPPAPPGGGGGGGTPQPAAPAAPAGGGGGHPAGMDSASAAQWAMDNINSEYTLDQWKAWTAGGVGKGPGQLDPACPSYQPFHTSKNVKGGDASACVDHPDACPPGTGAWGQNDCTPAGAGGGEGGGESGGGGGGAAPGGPAAPQVDRTPTITSYDPRKFTYGSTWAGAEGVSTPKPTPADPNPPPVEGVGQKGVGFNPARPRGPINPATTNQSASQARAVPGGLTGSTTATSLLARFPSLNI